MDYHSLWQGTENADDGTAVFRIGDAEYTIRLRSFDDFQSIEQMLHAAFRDGRECSERAIQSHLHRALNDARNAAL